MRLDEAFFKRVAITSAVVAAFGAGAISTGRDLWAAGAFLAGFLIGLGVLEATVAFAGVLVRPPDERPERLWPFVVLHIAKYLLVAVLFYYFICVARLDPIWFTIGVSLPLIVIFLKFAGQLALRHSNCSDGPDRS